ncbi:O-methyltransferase [Bifidobacterium pluvialisilvae]|uniref:O-methyltransferase n=1 Tax=Bifidobacterium pluvialisilvae TaxID=2834436 RepID=UPI001F389630|nr:class I SAM-dependent methyltransferase [Bifidobacterium pluvialisilvae]
MNRRDFTNIAKGWEFIENAALVNESDDLSGLREQADGMGFGQGSAAQADFLAFEARQLDARSVIILGTGAIMEALHLMAGLDRLTDPAGRQLTVVDSSAQGATAIRKITARTRSEVRLRVVNAKAEVFLPRLNDDDYDLVIISGDEQNYADAYDHAHRLLRTGGVLILCDALALENADSRGGLLNPSDRCGKATRMRQLIDYAMADERFSSSIIPTGTGMILSLKLPEQQ